ncbi:MAG: hypothetical protein QME75_09660 [Deltaproteobacteria bacterium]|nr:hypothetical protein [Deltaproteobacteria bacterium]
MRPSTTQPPGIMPLKLWLPPFTGLVLLCVILLRAPAGLLADHGGKARAQVVLTLDTDGNERGLPEGLHGWVSVQSAGGGAAATLFSAGAGPFALTLPASYSGAGQITVRLAGAAPAGRPIAIRPAPEKVEPAASKSEAGLSQRPLGSRVRDKLRSLRARLRPWVWAFIAAGKVTALILLAAGMAAAGFLAARRYDRGFRQSGTGSLSPPDMESQEKLLLLAQVESVQKEKAILAAKLGELEAKLKQAAAERDDLAARLEDNFQRAREKAGIIADLEEKLQDAKHEADAVQQEYLALYGRNPESKDVLKKG